MGNWWVSGGWPAPGAAYTAKLINSLIFDNGQFLKFTVEGCFNMVRPQGKMTPHTTSVSVNTCSYGYPALVFGACQAGEGITFSNTITIPPRFSGTREFYQVANTNTTVLWDVNWVSHRRVHNGQNPYADSPEPYGKFIVPNVPADSPGFGLPSSGYVRASALDNFDMWMGFRPTGGHWVPLRVVNWYWSGSATNGPGGWALESDAGDHSINPQDVETENYPLWKSDINDVHTESP